LFSTRYVVYHWSNTYYNIDMLVILSNKRLIVVRGDIEISRVRNKSVEWKLFLLFGPPRTTTTGYTTHRIWTQYTYTYLLYYRLCTIITYIYIYIYVYIVSIVIRLVSIRRAWSRILSVYTSPVSCILKRALLRTFGLNCK